MSSIIPRRTISIRGETYSDLSRWLEGTGCSMSSVLEAAIAKLMSGPKPQRTTKSKYRHNDDFRTIPGLVKRTDVDKRDDLAVRPKAASSTIGSGSALPTKPVTSVRGSERHW